MNAIATEFAFQANNHFRPLDWQLRLAHRIVGHGLPQPRHRDHAALDTTVRFLRSEARCRTDRDRIRLEKHWPAVISARRLAEANTPLAWEVRARILAGQSDEEITCRCGLNSETVHLFESLHFQVRDRLDAFDWVAARVIGPGLRRGFTQEEIGKLWMAVAFFGGPLALDAVLAATLENGVVVLPKPGDKSRGSTAEDVVRQRVLLAVGGLMMPADAPLRLLAQLQVRTRRHEARPKPPKVAEKIIADLTPGGVCTDSPSRKMRLNRPASMASTPEIS